MFLQIILFITVQVALITATQTSKTHNITLAFGSCFKFYRNHETDVFNRILQENPSYFLWLGDAAYVDYKMMGKWFPETDPVKVEEKFNITKNDKYYEIFRKKIQIKGTYDDHDINRNNGGKFNPYKAMTREKYLDFLDEPAHSPLRTQQGGIYQSFQLHENIMVIMTDIRYEADQSIGDNLGEVQWIWLEQQFQLNASLYILTSGIQILPDDRQGPEIWFPKSKSRLYALIRKYGINIIFLSGDVHYSEIMTHPCPNRLGIQLYELTSSGLTFGIADHVPFIDTKFKFMFPPTYSNPLQDQYYSKNYGIVRITINQTTHLPETIYLEIHSSDDSSVKLSRVIQIQDLKVIHDENSQCILDEPATTRFQNNFSTQIKSHQELIVILVVTTIILIITSIYLVYKWIKKVIQIYKQ